MSGRSASARAERGNKTTPMSVGLRRIGTSSAATPAPTTVPRTRCTARRTVEPESGCRTMTTATVTQEARDTPIHAAIAAPMETVTAIRAAWRSSAESGASAARTVVRGICVSGARTSSSSGAPLRSAVATRIASCTVVIKRARACSTSGGAPGNDCGSEMPGGSALSSMASAMPCSAAATARSQLASTVCAAASASPAMMRSRSSTSALSKSTTSCCPRALSALRARRTAPSATRARSSSARTRGGWIRTSADQACSRSSANPAIFAARAASSR